MSHSEWFFIVNVGKIMICGGGGSLSLRKWSKLFLKTMLVGAVAALIVGLGLQRRGYCGHDLPPFEQNKKAPTKK